jgi:hypothetical protein
MATVKIRHLVSLPGKAGSTRWYWRPAKTLKQAGWRDHRLDDDAVKAAQQAEALNAEVDAWRRGESPPKAPATTAKRHKTAAPGSIESLVADYKQSRWWLKLAPRTRKDYSTYLDLIIRWAGDLPARAITAPAVEAFYGAHFRRVEGAGRKRRVIETPAKAHAAIRVLRLLLSVGEPPGLPSEGQQPSQAARHQPGSAARAGALEHRPGPPHGSHGRSAGLAQHWHRHPAE